MHLESFILSIQWIKLLNFLNENNKCDFLWKKLESLLVDDVTMRCFVFEFTT